jgi:hypothetical protein
VGIVPANAGVDCLDAPSKFLLTKLVVKLLDGFRPMSELGRQLRERYFDVSVTGFVCEL